jgi:hypothetical protein
MSVRLNPSDSERKENRGVQKGCNTHIYMMQLAGSSVYTAAIQTDTFNAQRRMTAHHVENSQRSPPDHHVPKHVD